MIKILKFDEVCDDEIFARVENTVNVEQIVADIIANVRKNGDKALFEYCEKFDKAKLNKIAAMTRNAYARCINPVGTMADGDSIYTCSVGEFVSDVNLVGTLSAKVMQKAILKAIEASKLPDDEYLSHCL